MGWFSKKTVEEIVAPITKIVDELKEHAEHHAGMANWHVTKASDHDKAASVAKDEAATANQTASKISALIG